MREDSKKREALRLEEAAAEQAKEEEDLAKQAEALRLAEEERKKKEEEEYQAMKAMFSIDDGGSAADGVAAEVEGLGDFIGYIKVCAPRLVRMRAYPSDQTACWPASGLSHLGSPLSAVNKGGAA